ncbi:hypothetical protein Goklo_000772, partial [Gossypium klotzschianum]|nr:hypothetical protein [Gossypium klotzschianum]
MARIFNVSDNDPIDSSLHQLNVYRIYFGGDCDESNDYKKYLSESSSKSKKSQLDIYLDEPKFELNRQINVLDYWSKSSIQYSELSFFARHLLKIPISIVASETTFRMGKK